MSLQIETRARHDDDGILILVRNRCLTALIRFKTGMVSYIKSPGGVNILLLSYISITVLFETRQLGALLKGLIILEQQTTIHPADLRQRCC